MSRARSHSRPRPKNVVIAVMGPTGVGKSSFIKRITGCEDIEISHSLHPGTHQVKPYNHTLKAIGNSSYRAQTFTITILDCPGFDDPSTPDHTTITSILGFLDSKYYRGKKLHGIIYMLDICNPRVRGVDRRNIAMFQRLCGENFFSNVVLCTTHWDLLPSRSEGEHRETDLWNNPNFWGRFEAGGSKLARVEPRRNGSNRGDVEIVLDIVRKHHPKTLRAQDEMSGGLAPSETTAAREETVWNLRLTLQEEQLQERLREASARMKAELKENKELLQKELDEVEVAIARQEEDAQLQLARRIEEIEYRRRQLAERIAGKSEPSRNTAAGYPPTGREHQHESHKRRMEALDQQREQINNQVENTQLAIENRKRASHQEAQQQCKRRRQRYLTCDGRRRGECRKSIDTHRQKYYHCCFCAGDNYDHCEGCGAYCNQSPSHPKMVLFDRRKPAEKSQRHQR